MFNTLNQKITEPKDIIEHFHFLEAQEEIHNEQYLRDIEECDSLHELIFIVKTWIPSQTENEAMSYIFKTLDKKLY